jgi:hypothetical protein
MALLVDGSVCAIQDLIDQDAGLSDTAQNSNINLSTKIRLAGDDLSSTIGFWLTRSNPVVVIARVEQVVITPLLRLWATMHTLEMVYRDAYFSQLADRYKDKWNEFVSLNAEARKNFVNAGLGIVRDPVKAAAAPLLGVRPAPGPGGTFYASVAWVNAEGQAGQPSVPSSLAVPDGNLLTVSAVNPAPNVSGFNVYAGTSLADLYQQNDSAVLPGSPYLLALSATKSSGTRAGDGQAPESIVNLLSRANLRN